MLGEDLSFREKVVAISTMLSLMYLNVITPPPFLEGLHNRSSLFKVWILSLACKLTPLDHKLYHL